MKKINIIGWVSAVVIIITLAYCSEKSEDKSSDPGTIAIEQEQIEKGFRLLASNCINCHSPNKNARQKIAPTLAEIKRHYLDENTFAASFMQDIRAFVKNPSIETSKMPDAVQRYGLMPAMDFTVEELNAMSAYLYQAELEEDGWYKTQYIADRRDYLENNTEPDTSYLSLGKQYAMKTKSVLGKNLLTAIQSKGTTDALSFCNVQAIPLTDSMARELNVSIRRVSDKVRNPDNQANQAELDYIQQAKNKLENGEEIQPRIKEVNGKMIGYYPILTQQMCLQCHGDPAQDINRETLSKIDQLYPDDEAIHYRANQLRGIWVVSMNKRDR